MNTSRLFLVWSIISVVIANQNVIEEVDKDWNYFMNEFKWSDIYYVNHNKIE